MDRKGGTATLASKEGNRNADRGFFIYGEEKDEVEK